LTHDVPESGLQTFVSRSPEYVYVQVGAGWPEAGGPVPVLFTAHSVPCRTVQTPAASEGQPRHWPGEGVDPYAQEAKHTAEMVSARVPEIPKWWFAFQSQGASGGPWIGPTVEDTLTSIANEGVKTLLLQPIGFLCDHVEILYDLDIEARSWAEELGITLRRAPSLNASDGLVAALASVASGVAASHGDE